MEFCFLAKVVLLLSIIGISFDIYLFGFSILSFLLNIIFVGLFVWITNWSCYKEGYNWIAWIIVIFTFITFVTSLFIVKNRNNEGVKQILEEEKNARTKEAKNIQTQQPNE